MPWVIPLATAAYSVYSSARAASQRKKAEQGLENMKTPTYQPNQSILDYYQKTLQKYNTSPTDSAEYKLQKQNIQQGTTQAIAAGNDRRMGGASVPAIIQNQNNSLLKASVAGEQRKSQDLARLGQATQMKAGEDKAVWNQNSLAPFEKNYNLKAMKAAGQAQVQNASMQNAYNNLNAAASIYNSGKGDSNGGGGGNGSNWLSNIFGKKKRNAWSYGIDDSLPVNG